MEFPDRDILLENSDANVYIRQLCEERNWLERIERAVLFLDPFGMQVPWETIEVIARTKAIDLWYLFPIGIALNRLLRRDGRIEPSHRRKIDLLLGSAEWYNLFYTEIRESGLFEEELSIDKIANFELIKQYFVERLKTLFPGVADNPKLLLNSKNTPLYLLCFASANRYGAPTAIKIAQDILSRE